MAKNVIGTLYDDNAVPQASTSTGRSSTGLATGYASLVVSGTADPADAMTAANVIPTAHELYNGTTFDRAKGLLGIALVSSGGNATTAIASGTASVTVVKATPGRLCRIVITGAAGTTTGQTDIYDHASAGSGTKLVSVLNNTAIGTVVDVQMPAALGISVNGGANSPAMTISYI